MEVATYSADNLLEVRARSTFPQIMTCNITTPLSCQACMLLNNLQFVRIGLQSLYEQMGKELVSTVPTTPLREGLLLAVA